MTDARASRVSVEALTALVPTRRVSRVSAELLLDPAPPRRVSALRVEVLHATAANLPTAGTLTVALPKLRATITGTQGVPPRTGTLAATLPRIGAALTGTAAPRSRRATLDATLPRLGATITGSQTPPARTGTLAASLPRLGVSLAVLALAPEAAALTVTLPTVGGHLVGQVTQPPALLPALTADLHGVVPIVHRTDTTWRNDGHRYVSTAHVDYGPAVVDPPPGLHRQDVRRVHQSLPTPTIVKGRPQ